MLRISFSASTKASAALSTRDNSDTMDLPLEGRIRACLPLQKLDDAIVEYITSLLKENLKDHNFNTDPESLENEIGPFLV